MEADGLRPLRWLVLLLPMLVLAACHGSAPPDRGAQLYGNLCQSCHQRDGSGAKGLYPPLAGTPVPLGDAEIMAAWVLYGDRPAALPRGQYAGAMPQFNFLSDADAAAVLTYVRRSFGNQAAAVDADAVARVRAAHAGK